jgi:hypothetical protein
MYRVFALLVVFLNLGACTMSAPVDENYYGGNDKIAGGQPPSVPVVTFDKANLRFDFTASIDPETQAEVPTYFIYVYPSVPTKFYEARFIDRAISPPSPRSIYLTSVPFSPMTVILTGFDGYRESAINAQNMVTFEYP